MMTTREMRMIAKFLAEELSAKAKERDEYLSLEEAAKMMQVSPSYLRNNAKKVGCHKPFKSLVFSRNTIEEYIKGR